MYPQFFRTPQSFTTSTSEFITLLNDRVQEILDIVRATAGKDDVLLLIEGPDGRAPVADHQVGWLATTVTLFDALEKDIKWAFPSVYQAVGKAVIRFPDSVLHQEVAKTVAVLQILSNLPVMVHNVANLMHPAIDAAPRADAVKTAVDALLSDLLVPPGERNGTLSFFSEKLNDIEQERAQLPLRSSDLRRIAKEYCMSQGDVAARRIGELKTLVQRSLAQGSFLLRGETTAVDSLGGDLLKAAKKHLGPAAEQVFHRYAEAPEPG